MPQTPCVMQSDPTVAFTEDALWTVTHLGGTRCHRIDNLHPSLTEFVGGDFRPPMTGCGLPPEHDGGCIPCSAELLDSGIRLHPVARL